MAGGWAKSSAAFSFKAAATRPDKCACRPVSSGKGVEDAEGRFSQADREPRDCCRFLLYQRKTTAKKVFYLCLFPRLCFQTNPQSEFYSVSHGFLLKVAFGIRLLGCLGSDECYISNRFGMPFSCRVRWWGYREAASLLPFWKERTG